MALHGVGQVIATSRDDAVQVGSRLVVRYTDDEDEFTIVLEGQMDADAERVSAESPLGRALIGHRAGERVRFRAPGGIMGVTVVAVS
jgi:transcription elongation GreA/GreB family factor